MSNSDIVVGAYPFGRGLSPKLEKGQTYYVEISLYADMYMEDDEDLETSICGWRCKRKLVIK